MRPANNPDEKWRPPVSIESRLDTEILSVETRAQRLRKDKENPLQVPNAAKEFSKADIIEGQLHDESLEKCKLKAESGEILSTKTGAKSWYVKENELLYRVYQKNGKDAIVFKQMIVPKSKRRDVLDLAHASILSGHLGVRKTREKILCNFWWPGLEKDIKQFCRSCDVCQKTVAKGRVSSLPLGKMPIIETPFMREAVDIIGPIHPPSDDTRKL